MKRVINDTLISIAAVAMLLVILVSVDQRARDHFVLTARSASLEQAGERITQAGTVLLAAAQEQSVENAPMTVFVVAGLLLFIFMARM